MQPQLQDATITITADSPTMESSAGIKRRSVSIFSRRGAETALPHDMPLRMMSASQANTRSSANRAASSRWKLRRRSEEPTKGTVLRAVPQESLSLPFPAFDFPVERSRAPSPNTEILNAIEYGRREQEGEQALFSVANSFYPSSPTAGSVSSRTSTVSKKSQNKSQSIGVWKNGKAHWDSEPAIPLVASVADAFAVATPSSSLEESRTLRPQIQVMIPEGQQPRPILPGTFVASPQPTNTLSASEVSPPSSVVNGLPMRFSVVSPINAHSQPRQNRPFLRTPSLSVIEQEPDHPHHIPSHRPQPSVSNSSDSSSHMGDDDRDDASQYSKRSSVTSLAESEVEAPAALKADLRSKTGSFAFSILSPVAAGVFEEKAENAPQPLRRLSSDKVFRPVSNSLRRTSVIRRRNSTAREKARQSVTLQNIRQALCDMEEQEPSSPTLSEAEKELHKHLSSISISDNTPFRWQDWMDKDAEDLPVPVIPAKSSRRSQALAPPSPISRASSRSSTPLSATGSLQMKLTGLKLTIPENTRPRPVESKAPTLVEAAPQEPRTSSAVRNITADAAEQVILSILESLLSLDDLFATAVLNKGFYRVFKRHELELIRKVVHNMSAPAWEHREMSPPYSVDADQDSAAPKPEYTAKSYLRLYQRDVYIIAALKSLILERCQTFVRSETAIALASTDTAQSSRIDNAFWRIWSFCKMFGDGKGREDDIVGQMDWLKGGPLVNQKGCRATVSSNESFDPNCILANAPDYFAKGNNGGLSAEQLYDMTEIWNCLTALLSGMQGRTELARAHGVFDSADVEGGDIDGEEAMLEEWQHHLLTHGLSTVFDLAALISLPADDPSMFIKAAEAGWTQWTPPMYGGSRKTFMKEAVSRVYEGMITMKFAQQKQPTHQEVKEANKERLLNHIVEIRRRRASGEQREITMSTDRPMSHWEDALSTITASPSNNNITHSRNSSSSSAQSARNSVYTSSSSSTNNSNMRLSRPDPSHLAVPTFALPAASTTTTSVKLDEGVHPALRSLASDQHPVQRDIIHSDLAENTSDKAIYRIVEMGFTAEQARYALRVTDLGDGLRIDRAVELLLRG